MGFIRLFYRFSNFNGLYFQANIQMQLCLYKNLKQCAILQYSTSIGQRHSSLPTKIQLTMTDAQTNRSKFLREP